MRSTPIAVRIDSAVKARLKRLAKRTGRNCSFLATEAISEYLNVNEWQVVRVKTAGRGLMTFKISRSVRHQALN